MALLSSQKSAAYFTGWLLTITVIICRLLPMSVQTGMFFDGVTYATIARNMAIGAGDLWHPTFLVKAADEPSAAATPEAETQVATKIDAVADAATHDFTSEVGFYEHPPLALWLESLFFRLFGDHF